MCALMLYSPSAVHRAPGRLKFRRKRALKMPELSNVILSGGRVPKRELSVMFKTKKSRPVAFPSSERYTSSEVSRISGVSLRRSEEHTSELQSHSDLVCRLLLEKKKESK